MLPFDRFAGADALLGPEMRSTGEVMGVAPDFPAAFAKAQAAAGARLPARRHGVPHRHRLRQGGGRRDRRPAARPRLRDRRDARDGGGDRAHGHPGRDAEQAGGGLAARRRLDRARRRGSSSSTRRPAPRRARTATRSAARRSPAASRASRRCRAGWPPRARSPRRATGSPTVRLAAGDPPRPTRRGGRGRRRDASRRSAAAGCAVTGRRAARRLRRALGRRPGRAGARPGPVRDARRRRAAGAGGEDERPFLPRAFSVARRHADGTLDFVLEDVGPGHRAAVRAGARRGRLAARAARPRVRAAARRPPARARGRRGRDRAAGDLERRARRARRRCSASATPPTPRARRCSRARGWRPTTARPATTGWSPSCSAAQLATRRAEVYACGPPPMLEAVRALCAEHDVPAQLALESGMACGFGACFGCVVPTRDGYVRLCVDGPVLDAAALEEVALMTVSFCGIELAHPIVNASGTFDAIAARRAFGDALLERLPVRRLRLQDGHARAARGQPAAAAVGARRGDDQLDRAAEQGPRGLPRARPAASSPRCRCR